MYAINISLAIHVYKWMYTYAYVIQSTNPKFSRKLKQDVG